MARHEPIMSAGDAVVAGALYVVNGKPTISTITGTVSDLAAAIGGSPVIRQIDLVSRRHEQWPDGSDLFLT